MVKLILKRIQMEAKSLRNNVNLFFMIVITIPPRKFHLYAYKRENLRKKYEIWAKNGHL